MKGNIFSIEILIIAILLISILGFVYTIPRQTINNNFSVINLESKAINLFYFGTSAENTPTTQNKICKNIFYYTDSNIINEKNICEEII